MEYILNRNFDPIDIVFILLIALYLFILILFIIALVCKILIAIFTKKEKSPSVPEYKELPQEQHPPKLNDKKISSNNIKPNNKLNDKVKQKDDKTIKEIKHKLNDKIPKETPKSKNNNIKNKTSNPKKKNNSTKRTNGYVSPTKRKKRKKKKKKK